MKKKKQPIVKMSKVTYLMNITQLLILLKINNSTNNKEIIFSFIIRKSEKYTDFNDFGEKSNQNIS